MKLAHVRILIVMILISAVASLSFSCPFGSHTNIPEVQLIGDDGGPSDPMAASDFPGDDDDEADEDATGSFEMDDIVSPSRFMNDLSDLSQRGIFLLADYHSRGADHVVHPPSHVS